VAELRSFIFLNRLQPQTMCYLGTWIRGSLPRSDVAAQIIEIAPGLDIEPLTDVALKHANVRAGVRFEKLKLASQPVRMHTIVGIRTRDQIVRRMANPVVGCGGNAGALLTNYLHPRVPARIAFQDTGRRVSGAVIDDD